MSCYTYYMVTILGFNVALDNLKRLKRLLYAVDLMLKKKTDPMIPLLWFVMCTQDIFRLKTTTRVSSRQRTSSLENIAAQIQ